MTTTDHAAETLGLRALASEASTETYAANLLAAAQVHATLALTEQQRIANVLAYLDHAEGDEYERLHFDIKKGLGL